MTASDNTINVSVNIEEVDSSYVWTYSSDNAYPVSERRLPSYDPNTGAVTVAQGSGSWGVIYTLTSTDFQLFNAVLNTNPAIATRKHDFDQLLGLQVISGISPVVGNQQGTLSEVVNYESSVSVSFANNAGTPERPVGISFELQARSTVDATYITSPDPQVKNEGDFR
jgi:hypothetical protein